MRTVVMTGVIALWTSACSTDGTDRGTDGGTTSDGPVHPTVAELAGQADLVLLGTPSEVVGRAEAVDGTRPVAMSYWRVPVESVLAGEAGTRVVVAWPEQAGEDPESQSPVEAGTPLVLFLERVGPAVDSTPVVADEVYVTVGGDQGVFDVDGDAVQARSEHVRGLDRPGRADGRLRVPLSELTRTVQAAR